MLLFNAKFAVSDSLSRQQFLDMLTKYLLHVKDYGLSIKDHIDVSQPQVYESGSDDGLHKFMLCITDTHFAVRLWRKEDSLIATDTYVLTMIDDVPVMSVQLDRSLCYPSMKSECFSDMPLLVKSIFWEEYGGVDHGIKMDDKPYILRKEHVAFAKDVLNHEIELFNPVVYVTVDPDTGEYPVDCQFLASRLVGLSHVFIEGSPPVADLIREDCPLEFESGDILLLFPSGEVCCLYEKSMGLTGTEINQHIITQIHQIMASVVIEDAFSFDKIHTDHLLTQTDHSDLSEVCDELLSEKDNEIKALQKELENVKATLSQTEAKAASMSQAFDDLKKKGVSGESESGVGLNISCDTELYPGEWKDVVLKLINREVLSMENDSKLKTSRKFDVLSSIDKNNQQTGKDVEISDKFCKVVENGTLTAETINEIERLGFIASKAKNGHFKIAYNGDARYQCTVSATPSDHRAGDNLGKSYMNMLFGF